MKSMTMLEAASICELSEKFEHCLWQAQFTLLWEALSKDDDVLQVVIIPTRCEIYEVASLISDAISSLEEWVPFHIVEVRTKGEQPYMYLLVRANSRFDAGVEA